MCGLCGVFGEVAHWSTAGVAHGSSRRQRMFRVGALNHVLSLRHLKVQDFSGTDYVLGSATGKYELVKEVGQLWQSAEKMLGYPMDPLDDELINAYQATFK